MHLVQNISSRTQEEDTNRKFVGSALPNKNKPFTSIQPPQSITTEIPKYDTDVLSRFYAPPVSFPCLECSFDTFG